jgi:hypothetical protein
MLSIKIGLNFQYHFLILTISQRVFFGMLSAGHEVIVVIAVIAEREGLVGIAEKGGEQASPERQVLQEQQELQGLRVQQDLLV